MDRSKHLSFRDRDPRRCQFERAGGPAEKDLGLPAGRQGGTAILKLLKAGPPAHAMLLMPSRIWRRFLDRNWLDLAQKGRAISDSASVFRN
jgi:hypothetical protein